jgi:hypothetical protein
MWAVAIACIPYYALAVIFLTSPSASELIGRGQSLILIPVGLLAVVGLDRGDLRAQVRGRHRRRRAKHRSARLFDVGGLRILILGSVMTGIAVGGILATWPPYPGKLPGPYNIEAYERSTDQHTIDLGIWMSQVGETKQAFAADHRESLLVNAITGDGDVLDPSGLFQSTGFRSSDASFVRENDIGYVIADYRMTTELPGDGAYFLNDPLGGYYIRPLPAATLNKFNTIIGVSRVFDDGAIIVYVLDGSMYDVPQKS